MKEDKQKMSKIAKINLIKKEISRLADLDVMNYEIERKEAARRLEVSLAFHEVLYREVWKFALGCGAEPLLGRAPAGAAHSGIPWSC